MNAFAEIFGIVCFLILLGTATLLPVVSLAIILVFNLRK